MALTLQEFADKVNEILPVMMREFARRHAGALIKEKVTLPQFFVLDYLILHGESKMKDLAGYMEVSTAAMTGTVERLVRDGYLRRAFDQLDRRIIKVVTTPRATVLVRRMNEQRRSMLMRIFGQLEESDRAEYLRILTQVRKIIATKDA